MEKSLFTQHINQRFTYYIPGATLQNVEYILFTAEKSNLPELFLPPPSPRNLPHYLTLTATSVNTHHLPGEIPGPSWPPGTCLAFKTFKDILKHPELSTCKLFSSLAGLVNVCSSFGNSFRHPLLAELCQELLAPFPLQVERRVAFFVLSANPVLSTPWMSMSNSCFLDYELPEGREHVYSSLCALWLKCLFVDYRGLEAERNPACEYHSPSTKGSWECNPVTPRLAKGASWLNYCSKGSPGLTMSPPVICLQEVGHFHSTLHPIPPPPCSSAHIHKTPILFIRDIYVKWV